jgi:Carboxypeptidase regulatory-like domain
VLRRVAVIFALLLLSGCGSGDRYAGLTRDEAARESVHVAREMREPAAVADMWGPRKRVPIGTWRSRNLRGQAAWLTVFKLTGVANDSDQACVWAWRETSRSTTFEETASVAWGLDGDPAHDGCADEVRTRGIAGSEQTMGSDVTSPPVATPTVVAPFGAWEASSLPTGYAAGEGVTLTGYELLLPNRVPRGTCGFAGFVIDASTYRPLRGARVSIAPAGTPKSVVATTDDLGSFAFSGLPVVARGFDITVSVAGYAISRGERERCYPGDFAIGDWTVTRASTIAGR